MEKNPVNLKILSNIYKQGSLLHILHSYSMFLMNPQISKINTIIFLITEKITEKFCYFLSIGLRRIDPCRNNNQLPEY